MAVYLDPTRPGPSLIILALHHAVADGISSLVIVRDLLATCSALVEWGNCRRICQSAGR